MIFAIDRNTSEIRWLIAPEPEEEYEYLSGLARRSEMNSFTFAAGNEGCVTSTYGPFVNWLIGEKSVTGS